MAKRTISIEEATPEQLRVFADTHLGISIHANAKPETVRAKIAAAWGKPEIILNDPDEDEAPTMAAPPVKADAGPGPGKVRLILQTTEDADGDEPVAVGVNGRVMLIPRGKEVEIPEDYFEVLKNAVTHRYQMMPDGQSMNPVPRAVPLYPFQRLA